MWVLSMLIKICRPVIVTQREQICYSKYGDYVIVALVKQERFMYGYRKMGEFIYYLFEWWRLVL